LEIGMLYPAELRDRYFSRLLRRNVTVPIGNRNALIQLSPALPQAGTRLLELL